MTLNESQLNEVISQCICEAFGGFGGLAEFFNNGEFSEEKKNDPKKDKKDSKKKSNNTDKSEEENSKKEKGSNAKRAQIEDFFDKPGVNNAQYAYKLYGVKPVEGKDTLEMKNARSQFQKDLHHDLNDSGYPYEFTPQELNRLQSMISNNQLSEARLNKIISESIQKFMSDDEIESQYSEMKITYFEMNPLRHSEGWKGTFELEFPNADGIDYDETMVNDFIAYDADGKSIAWSNWMPDEQTKQLESIIRREISKRNH